jgi:hypothetical protein
MDTFSMKETTTSKVYFVNCQKQRLPKSCGNLRVIAFTETPDNYPLNVPFLKIDIRSRSFTN